MPTSEENKQFVLASYQAFATREKDRIAAYFAPDAEWNAPEPNATAVALGQPAGFMGREAIVTYLTGTVGGDVFKGSKVELLSVIADGDSVVVEQRFEATVCNGPGYKIAKTTPCKVEWPGLAALVLRCVRGTRRKMVRHHGPT